MKASILALLGGILATRFLNREKPVYISVERANAEWKKQQMDMLDFVYMERVKDRMTKGDRCTHPPLFDHGRYSRPRLVISHEEAC